MTAETTRSKVVGKAVAGCSGHNGPAPVTAETTRSKVFGKAVAGCPGHK